MKIALVHNPTAGGGHDVDDLVKLLTDAGHEVRHRSSSGDWKSLLQDSGDLVVAAGGDGTVRKVALAAADHGIPFGVLPIGTANNIGKTLGMLGDARELVDGWSANPPPLRKLDLGELKAENRTERFVESVGGGPVAELIARGEEIGEQSKLLGRETDQALHLLTELLRAATPSRGASLPTARTCRVTTWRSRCSTSASPVPTCRSRRRPTRRTACSISWSSTRRIVSRCWPTWRTASISPAARCPRCGPRARRGSRSWPRRESDCTSTTVRGRMTSAGRHHGPGDALPPGSIDLLG